MEKKEKFPHYLILFFLIIAITVIPLIIRSGAEFGGSDGEGEAVINQVNPDYHPWFSNIWTPPSGEIENLLFCLQAALGAGVLGYCIGYMKGKHRGQKKL